MSDSYITDGMLEMFLYETDQMLEQLEAITLEKQTETSFDDASVNEIFRIMHTIKGSSGVMMYTNITKIAHKLEDVFYYLRESHPTDVPHEELIGYILDVTDFVKNELDKIKEGKAVDGDSTELWNKIDAFLGKLKNDIKDSGSELPPENTYKEPTQFYIPPAVTGDSRFYEIHITYSANTDMANIRAYTAVFALKELAEDLRYVPEDIVTNEASAEVIIANGFLIGLRTTSDPDAIMPLIQHASGVEQIDIRECDEKEFNSIGTRSLKISGKDKSSGGTDKASSTKIDLGAEKTAQQPAETKAQPQTEPAREPAKPQPAEKNDSKPKEKREVQSYISVNVNKMDQLMDMIGELVIAEAVVLQNADLKVPGLELTSFNKAAAQLAKITSELQETIMSMRMMPLTNTFQKMTRIVYDVSKKLGKEIELKVVGETTEVDKNIIEHISDPLMHLIRNSVDHGIEDPETREKAGKPKKGVIILEAKNEGGKVWISVKDDGKGLDREKLLDKARKNGLLNNKSEKDMSDKEVYNLITLPGFSTKEQVTEFSGRGVGMDVVVQNINAVGGTLDIESTKGQGSEMILKIPLTLAIIDGIIVAVGKTNFVVSTGDVKEFIRVTDESLVVQPEGDEGVMIRGECYPIIRLKDFYHIPSECEHLEDGILAILEHEDKKICVFVDKLVGEQEIVVKPIPSYIKKVKGLSGCTQLGDGSISLILDTAGILKERM